MLNVPLPLTGQTVHLVPRDLMRRKSSGKTLRVPFHLRSVAAQIPTPPASFDGSKGRSIKYPILGNDRYGDCYYADACHCVQTWTGNVGSQALFDANVVTKRYLAISGGDNGLGDDQIFPEWKRGIIGPNGPYTILDDMTVDPRDDAAIRLGIWLFCGASYTAALPDKWINSAAPGAVWDAGTPNQSNGHAMHLSGYSPDYYFDETWAIDPPIRLTPRGLKSSDPEVTVQFSLHMFRADGTAPHNGMNYDQLAALWHQLGGATLPPSPFGPTPPVPIPPTPVPPTPTPPGRYLYTTTYTHAVQKGGRVSGFIAPVDIPAGSSGRIYAPPSAAERENEVTITTTE